MVLNYTAILLATVVQFVIGAIWYTAIFGGTWRKFLGIESISKEEQAQANKDMLPYLAIQFVFTFITSFVFMLLLKGFPSEWNIFGEAGFFWLGFVVPVQVSAVMFGGTPKKWLVQKTLVMNFGSLACLLGAAVVFHLM
jgi:hypothetical protein